MFDGRNPTPQPPIPRDPGDSHEWRSSHAELGARLGGRLDDLERRFNAHRDAAISAHGTDGKNGKLSVLEKRMDGARQLLIAVICASLGALGTAATGWLTMKDQVTRVESRLETIAPVAEAITRVCKGGIP